jgi:hypothetical protein
MESKDFEYEIEASEKDGNNDCIQARISWGAEGGPWPSNLDKHL